MQYYGICGVALDILHSYLTDRKQCACVNSKLSDFLNVNYRVPQGSILGPFLLIIMINDSVYNVPTTFPVLYADHTSFINVNQDLEVLNARCKDIMETNEYWFTSNEFVLHKNKT